MNLYEVKSDGSPSQLVGKLKIDKCAGQVVHFDGNDPTILATKARARVQVGAHLHPINNNFPTYDLYVVCEGSAFKLDYLHQTKKTVWLMRPLVLESSPLSRVLRASHGVPSTRCHGTLQDYRSVR